MAKRTESVVAAELAKADAEHDAACERAKQTANKRGKLALELKAIRSGDAQPEEATEIAEPEQNNV